MEGIATMCARCTKYYNYLNTAHRSFSVSSTLLSSSLYDVLNVPRTASSKEIKEAYFSLSKELHPDRNPSNPEQHRKFVELNEAYNVLIKPLSRSQYDERFRFRRSNSTTASTYRRQYANDWYQEVDYTKYSRGRGHYRGYYGILGLGKLSNRAILYGVLLYLVAGAFFHFFIYQKSSEYAQQRMNRKDEVIGAMYNAAKQKAMKNGNEKQMQLIRKTHEDARSKRSQYAKNND